MKKIVISFLVLVFAGCCFGQTSNFFYSSTCFGTQTHLAAISTLPDTAISSWQWDLDNNGTYDMSGKIIIYLFSTSTTNPVKLKITPHSGAADSITKVVLINPLPNVDFRVDNLCALSAATYINLSTIASGSINSALNIWDFDNNGVANLVGGDTVTYTSGVAQTYYTRLTCVSDSGCSAFAIKTTTVYPLPVAQFTSSDLCFKDSTKFTNTSVNPSPDFYIWNFGDGNSSTTSGNAAHVYPNAGAYNVSLIAATINGCRDTSSVSNIVINSLPAVSVMARGDTVFYAGASVELIASGATTYVWNTFETTDSIRVDQGGGYLVTGTDANGCKSSAAIQLMKKDIPDTVAVSSNILTPNGDGINDYLVIDNKEAYQTCKISIYNMWNDIVYSADGYNNDWDGTSSGKQLPDGAYYYIITCDDKPVIKGTINILLDKNQNRH